ncbi:MAG: hypothetical protein COA45_07205 [Zetaproteobacteria bacterium]|nr:MAG: hypothetical protein COA45_07205 [Zetaproteobacteria bacterium]
MHHLSKKGQETRQAILMCAFDLFHERGIHATTVDDILRKSGAGKSQFYHYFKNKQDIIHELLQLAYQMIKDGQTHFQPIHTWDDFRGWLDASIEEIEGHGCSRACPIGQIICQISEDDVLLHQDIKLVFGAMKDYPKNFFIALQARGELSDNADPDEMADMCIATMQGSAMIAKVNQNITVSKKTANHLFAYMHSFVK